jgi:hypothetical protein
VDGTGSGSCPVAGFVISRIEPSGSVTRDSIIKTDLREIGCEDGRWMELSQDRVQWRALLLAMFTVWAQLRELIVSSECRNDG